MRGSGAWTQKWVTLAFGVALFVAVAAVAASDPPDCPPGGGGGAKPAPNRVGQAREEAPTFRRTRFFNGSNRKVALKVFSTMTRASTEAEADDPAWWAGITKNTYDNPNVPADNLAADPNAYSDVKTVAMKVDIYNSGGTAVETTYFKGIRVTEAPQGVTYAFDTVWGVLGYGHHFFLQGYYGEECGDFMSTDTAP